MTAAFETIGRQTIFNDTQANVAAGTAALVEIRFARDTATGLIGYTIDGGTTWTWLHAGVTLAASADAILGLTGQQLTADTQSANRVLAGPTTGAAAAPTFRALVAADLGTETPDGTKFLRDDLSWQAGAGGGVARNGSTTDHHLAVWNGADADSIEDGGAIPGGIGTDGWIAADAMTYASADDPTYTLTVSGDKSGTYQAGQRVKLTQATGGTKYFIVTKVAVSGDTTLTLYGGTDYNLENEAISNPYYSPVKAPFGFPVSPAKWTASLSDTSIRTKATPTQNAWHNDYAEGGVSLSIPIGVWDVEYQAVAQSNRSTSVFNDISVALSTANNSASDAELISIGAITSATSLMYPVGRGKTLTLAAKTTYYLNLRAGNTSVDNIYIRGDLATTVIRAVCAYL